MKSNEQHIVQYRLNWYNYNVWFSQTCVASTETSLPNFVDYLLQQAVPYNEKASDLSCKTCFDTAVFKTKIETAYHDI